MTPIRTRFRRGARLGLAVLALAGTPFPQGPAGPVHFTLRNGLEVILASDTSLPNVSIALAYRVGSADDPPGKAGLAYLMETLMFSGSANVGPLQHINTMYRIGGNFNATADENRTIFFQTVPSHYLGLVLWLESDRMRSLEMTPEAFELAREDHVRELRRRRLEEPFLESGLVFDQLIFPEPALHHPLSGTEESLQALTIEDARTFYTENYVPNRAVLSIAGQFDRIRARELIVRYFETIPRGKDIPRVAPPPTVPFRKVPPREIRDELATSPAFFYGFRLGSASSADMYPLGIIEYVLLKGPAARLNRRLLDKNNKIAFQAGGGIDVRGGDAVFRLFVVVNTESMLAVCQNALAAEFDRLRRAFVTEPELLRAKRELQADMVDRFSTPTGLAFGLAEAFLSLPDFSTFSGELERSLSVAPYDIRAAANRYFTPENLILVNVRTK